MLFAVVFLIDVLPAFSQVRITFLDIGEGLSVVIDDSHTLAVLDTGNMYASKRLVDFVRQRLKALGKSKADYLFLTHPHLDHIGGVFDLMQRIGFQRVFDNGEDITGRRFLTEDISRWYTEVVRKSDFYSRLRRGDILKGGYELKILWPEVLTDNVNTNSLVIMLRYGSFKALFMGDGNIATEKKLLARNSDVKADLLQVGHHGASDSSSLRFLQAVSPKIAVISVDRDNIRGYPAKETVKRLKSVNAKVLQTSENGNITVVAEKNGMFRILMSSPADAKK